MPLELDSLRKALATLERSLDTVDAHWRTADEAMRETLRAGVIQHFKVAFELCWKYVQRWLRENRSPEEADHPRSRKDLFRLAAHAGLIEDPVPWFGYAEARNLSVHTYSEKRAEQVYQTARRFLRDARYVLEQLEAHND